QPAGYGWHTYLPNQCFIPSISALDVYESQTNGDLYYDIQTNIERTEPHPDKYPFEAYTGFTSDNQQHIFVSHPSGNDEWMEDEILQSQYQLPTNPAVLSTDWNM